MISCLKGELFHKSPEKVTILVNGVGYEVFLSSTSLEKLPQLGEDVFLHTYTHVREDVLTLSTVHSAKGLEWDCVIIIWVMEGYFPSARAGGSEEGMEEERRLMYVAATRAKNTLILCYPGEETPPAWFAFGNAGMGYRGGLSSFIQALPTDVMELGSSGRQRVLSPLGRKPQRRFEKKGKKPPSSELRSGDRVSHPAFGPGVISKFVDSEKVEVLFRDAGRKLLHLGFTTLEKN